MLFRNSIDGPPRNQPDKAESTCDQKCRSPSIVALNPWNDEWRCQRADVRAGVEDAGRQSPFVFGKPFRNGLDAGREVAGLAQSQRNASRPKAHHRLCQRMRHCRQTPEHHRQGKALSCSQPVHHSSGKQQADGVSELKGKNDVAVVNLIPTNLTLKSLLKQTYDLAVNVVDGSSKKQQRTDNPAIVAYGVHNLRTYATRLRGLLSGHFSC